MITTYVRSSSYGSWDFCQLKYYLNYVLGLPDKPHNNKADRGNLCHKALELLGKKKLAQQLGQETFSEAEIGKTWDVTAFSPEHAFSEAWDYYVKVKTPHWDWNAKELKTCKKIFGVALTANAGAFNPLNNCILEPEQYFDFEIDEPWANYKFTNPFGATPQFIEGKLAIKGTVDLVSHAPDDKDIVLYTDWKTGQRKDWVTNKPKGFSSFRKDFQLRLYHYALTRLYPNAKAIIITIFWLNDGGPFPIPFSREDIPETMRLLRERFETIVACEKPGRIKPNFRCNWCYYDKTPFTHKDGTASEACACDFIHKELKQLGLDRVTAQYGDQSRLGKYGDGGGVTKRE